jgi:hypothetical protein
MSYNSRPPGSRQQPQPVQQQPRVRLDNDETESFYSNIRKPEISNNNSNTTTTTTNNNNTNNISNSTTNRRSIIDANARPGSQLQLMRRESERLGDAAAMSNEISPVRKRWLKAFESIRSQLPSVSRPVYLKISNTQFLQYCVSQCERIFVAEFTYKKFY